MSKLRRFAVAVGLFFVISISWANESVSAITQKPMRVVVMPYKLLGNIDQKKLDSEHLQRLQFADKTLRSGLEETRLFELVDEKASKEFSNKVDTAISNNACNRCETALAKDLNAKQIVVPWVYRLSQLVLTMHFVILDADTGKTVLKKSLDFRGDNDQSWQRAIQFFVKTVGDS